MDHRLGVQSPMVEKSRYEELGALISSDSQSGRIRGMSGHLALCFMLDSLGLKPGNGELSSMNPINTLSPHVHAQRESKPSQVPGDASPR